jgi:hypothetical protein
MMIKFLFHTATNVLDRQIIIDAMAQDRGFDKIGEDLQPDKHYFHFKNDSDTGKHVYCNLTKYLARMYDYYPVGVCNTIGYANPRSGDTVSSVMIGGLRTVMNGDWEVQAGDVVQWYWTFEKDCFDDTTGKRNRFQLFNADGDITQDYFGMDPAKDVDELAAADLAERGDDAAGRQPRPPPRHIADLSQERRKFNDRQYGMKPQSTTPSDKSKSVARIKTYVKDPFCPRIYDEMRVCGRAIGTARPNELLDIQISRQSM